jgi:hypothetical protein
MVTALALLAAACDHYAAAGAGAPETGTPELTPVPTMVAEAQLETCPTVLAEAGAAVVDTLRLSDGSCVPVDVAVVYRCDPSLDPVAVLDLHGERNRFLGGTFAVAVPALPEGVRALGITALGRVFEIPGDPRWLFVESGGGFERWMALPPLGSVGDPPSVQLIGDSILDGADETLVERLPDWSLAIDAEVGRSTAGGTTVAESLAPIIADLVVIELGVNDFDEGASEGYADRILAASAVADGVLWVNAHGPDPETDAVNAAIATAVGRAPSAAIADWDAGVPPDALSSDGVHLLDGAGTPFVEFLAPILESWHLTAMGRGADRCGAQVVAAA